MRPVYVEVDIDDAEGETEWHYTVSLVPFRYSYGELVSSKKNETKSANSYDELRKILVNEYRVPQDLVPSASYFDPTTEELEEQAFAIYRTVPEGMGEPDWRINARAAVLEELDQADFAMNAGVISINGRHCYSFEELKQELEKVAEEAGGKQRIPGEPYQPDYDVVVNEAIGANLEWLSTINLPKKRRPQ